MLIKSYSKGSTEIKIEKFENKEGKVVFHTLRLVGNKRSASETSDTLEKALDIFDYFMDMELENSPFDCE